MNNSVNKVEGKSVVGESKLMAKHSLIYGLGNVLNRVIGFVMIPVYTRYLIPSEYGILELLGLTTEFIGMLLSLRISRAMNRFFFEYDSIQDKNEVISTAIISFGAIGLAGLFGASLGSGFFAEKILDSSQYAYYFNISFATLWFNTLILMAYDYLQMLKKSTLFIILSSTKLFINLFFTIYFIVFLKMGVLGILYGNLIAAIFMTLVLVMPILIKVGARFSRNKMKEMLKFGLPLVPGALANFIVLVSDRYFVKIFGSLADTGIYSLSYKFGILPHTFVTVPFFQIWSVRRFELLKHKDAEELMGKVITYFFFVITFIGLGLSVLTKDILEIVADSRYWDAYKYVPILVLSYIVFGLFNHFAVNILIEKKTEYLTYIDVGNGVLNVLLNIILIKSYGIYGAAFATLISYIVRIALLYFVSSRLEKIYFEFLRALKIILTAIFVFVICNYIELGNHLGNIALKSLVIMTWPVVLYFSKFYNRGELDGFKNYIHKRDFRAVLK